MASAPTQRPTREWLLLALALVAVAAAIVPAWRAIGPAETAGELLSKWTPERVGRLLLGPEQAACYVAAVWATLILFSRSREVRRQQSAFGLGLLPTDEGARILPEDARPLARKVDAESGRGASILGNMVRLGLNKYAVSKSGPDVAEVVRNQADVEASRLVATMGTVNYLVWAIPAIGFLGTVRGLAGGMSMASSQEAETAKFIKSATDQLAIAFDCTGTGST